MAGATRPFVGTKPARKAGAGRRRRQRPEQEAGRNLIKWIDRLTLPCGTRPGEYFAHCPNGGARSAIEAAILAGQGVRAGWPDYTLYLPRGHYHGLVLELKAADAGKPEVKQLDILQRLALAGYRAEVAWGFDQARSAVELYLALPATEPRA